MKQLPGRYDSTHGDFTGTYSESQLKALHSSKTHLDAISETEILWAQQRRSLIQSRWINSKKVTWWHHDSSLDAHIYSSQRGTLFVESEYAVQNNKLC